MINDYRFLVFLCMCLLGSAKAEEIKSIQENGAQPVVPVQEVDKSETEPATPGAEQTDTQSALPGLDNILEEEQTEPTATFDILEYRIVGNTLLSKLVIETAVYPSLGSGKTIDNIEQARTTLEKEYKAAGYPAVIVNIPEQTVNKGIVILEVVEGKIERVKITGSKYHSLSKIRKNMPALVRGNVFYLPDVQKQLADLNRASQDRSVTPILRPGRAPGTVEVELMVKDEFPIHGNIEINNQNTVDTTSTRAGASLRYDNLFQKQHSLSLQYQTSPEDTTEVNVYAGTYMFPVGYPADHMLVYVVQTDSNVTTLGDTNVLGNGQIIGLRWIKSLSGSNSYFHNFSAGIDYKNFKDTQGGVIFPISYWPITIRYDGSSIGEKSLFQFNLGSVFGAPVNANQDEFSNKRFGSNTNFIYFTAGSSYKYTLENGAEFRTKINVQLATSPLISNEQFSIGGASTVRGYHESQVLGDSGLNVSLELVSPHLLKTSSTLNDLRILGFWDGGHADRIDPLPGEEDQVDIAGTGLGLRLRAYQKLNIELDAAMALKDRGVVKKNDVRWHFKLIYEF